MIRQKSDETSKDVLQQRRPREVVEVLFLRIDSTMGHVAEWVLAPCVVPEGWIRTRYTRQRIVFDNE